MRYGNALLKFISPNDAGLTRSHQCGFYMPIPVWEMYTPHPPTTGRNDKHSVSILWQDGRVTDSVITWYGAAKHEYRLTRFGRDFPFLNADMVGDLLVLIPKSRDEFIAYVLDYDEDIEDLQSALGVEAFQNWGVYQDGVAVAVESEDECIDRLIREASADYTEFPTGGVFSEVTRKILQTCLKKFAELPPDEALMRAIETEYQLFQSVERIVCQNLVAGRLFRTFDEFIQTALSILNRRKARAGRSFENHVEYLLTQAGVPHKMRPALGADGRPDILIPSEDAYFDLSWPEKRLFVIGLKTTCKDRWRQVLNEGRRVQTKHIVTLQQGITGNQLKEMQEARVSLVVPKSLHGKYPKAWQPGLLDVHSFIEGVKQQLAAPSE
ncbi:MAG: type II restriction endonuclease [Bryobacteraceae bacterium]|nr:type II restriction endonuclease [Bryobacteraceae bacterium]